MNGRAQINFLEEIIVDNFAGGGGASTGIELATGRPVTIAINHDPDAILMHKTNHPFTEHYQASVWDVDPYEVSKGRPVGLAWFSPDCKHFSKAKGGKPVDKNIRGLAWIVLRWAGTVRPRVIILENVEEFRTWGPVRRGRPVKSKAGQTFRKWLSQLQGLGYAVEWRELVAADYGAPTTRKRFFLVARCDGAPIVWPEPTHTQVSKAEECVVAPALIQYHTEQTERVRGQGVADPIMTIDASNRYGLAAASLVKYYGSDQHGQNIGDPLHTVTAKDREAVLAAHITEYHGASIGTRAGEPAATTLGNDHQGIVATHMVKMKGTNLGGPMSEPVQTITAGGGHFGVVTTVVARAEPGAELGHWPEIRDLLNTYCGYNLGQEDVILFEIDGAAYFLADIGLRMLTPRELYMANGFPVDYKIERDYTGTVYPKTKQVARCGNAVPPPFATALVRANLPEWCSTEIRTMAELEREVAV